MTLGLDQTLPRWLIDDTAEIERTRVFIFHTQEPKFVGEVVPAEKADLDGIKLTLPGGKVVSRIAWYDNPSIEMICGHDEEQAAELAHSLAEALKHHNAARP
jgi:hypothetical protein